MADDRILPHKLTLSERKALTLTGATEVISFDENLVALKTSLGDLMIHGQGLQLKNLSLESAQVAVEGNICAIIYEQSRKSGGTLRRLFG